ncbi:hypothetical protein H2204_002377 [Knufia peltigerae]|uniref:SET domain-containing protein n=1 Tax=Knufia peltigerae TaxID=1002370 RepID=A0AA39D1Q5_9EURO|nr:hypothetical protein H2204_002377 [Knufia peltigerae]
MEPDNTKLQPDVVETRHGSSTPPLHMNNTAEPEADIFHGHRRLVDWVLANNGYFHPHAQIAFSRRKGFHAVVANGEHVSAGTRVASCPISTTISVLNALEIHPFQSHGTRFPEGFLRRQRKNPESLQTFFLMEQLVLGEQSWWAPYIATLPTVQEVMDQQFDEEKDLIWLQGTNLPGGISERISKWKEMYLCGLDELKELQWQNALTGEYTWPRFLWAATIFGSRSFTSQVLGDTEPAEQARHSYRESGTESDPNGLVHLFSQRFAVLLPLMDLLNHKPGAQVEWQARFNFVGLQLLESYESEQELYNNYGPRENEGLLLAYGFTVPDNPFDHLVISIRTPPGSPLALTHTWQQDPRSDPERRCYIFDCHHPRSTSATLLETSLFSFDLLDSISVLCANERELQMMLYGKQTLMSYCLGDKPKFEDGRIVLATISQLLMDCSERASRLRATDPSRFEPPLLPENLKQQNAKTYRDSQLNIVETAIAICKFVLIFATSEDSREMIQNKLQRELSDRVFTNLHQLLERHQSQLTHSFELLTPSGILDMLSPELSTSLQNCISRIKTNHEIAAGGGEMSQTNVDKVHHTVILAALYEEYLHGVKLPRRITQWLKQLAEWYPLDSESWAYVPGPGPWDPGEEPPSGLMDLLAARAAMSPTFPAESNVKRWMKPEKLCWGWNVIEEQNVRVPASILGQAETENSGQSEGRILIYWQKY